MALLCVDPGLRGCGCAFFDGARLKWAAYVPNPMTQGRGPEAHAQMARAVITATTFQAAPPDKLLVEFPRVYPGMPKVDLNDLLDLAGVDGALSTMVRDVGHVFPSDWKGQVPKQVMNERVLMALSVDEVQAIEHRGSKDHNTLDAIGIGLHHFGRINRRRS